MKKQGDAKVKQPGNAGTGDDYVVITGGAGFIGTNLAHRLLSEGHNVLILDNLSRRGTENNLRWLLDTHGNKVRVRVDDVRNGMAFKGIIGKAKAVYHFAAQVAVTTSVVDPIDDFKVNCNGTLNLLEEIRASENRPPLIFTSTNKVYGSMSDIDVRRNQSRYAPVDPQIRKSGVSEKQNLEFYSPYGCSKGAADQYILDYSRIYRLPAAVFRMSCIYGPHQHGTEDQGWVAHFILCALQNQAITIYGDGMQVRDILFVNDLVDALIRAWHSIDSVAGRAFNIGGGPSNTVSLLELMSNIRKMHGSLPQICYSAWRPGDQKYYVSDTSRFRSLTGWSPETNVREGLKALYDWLVTERSLSEPSLTEREKVA